MMQKLKDTALSKGAKTAINTQIAPYGKILTLDLDSKNKTLKTEVMLEGESEPLRVSVERYALIYEENRYFLEVYGVRSSRIWIDRVVADYIEGKRFKIPLKYAKLLKTLI